MSLFYGLLCRRYFVAVGDDSGVKPDRWCGVTFEHKPVLAQVHRVPLIYESHSHISGWRKGFEMTFTVLNESTSEGIKKTSSGVY